MSPSASARHDPVTANRESEGPAGKRPWVPGEERTRREDAA
jgi:hypothetical protein